MNWDVYMVYIFKKRKEKSNLKLRDKLLCRCPENEHSCLLRVYRMRIRKNRQRQNPSKYVYWLSTGKSFLDILNAQIFLTLYPDQSSLWHTPL